MLVTIAGYTPLPQEVWWRHAMFSHIATEAVKQTKVWLPSSLASMLPY
jgi:membrane protein required for colicin V production